jgi:hypothetical protein
MITNSNVSRTAPTEEYVDIKKWVGVGSVSIVAINPNNAKLREFGWSIAEDAAEPVYAYNKESNTSGRIRFLVKLEDVESKPVVAMDFFVRPEIRMTGREGDSERKCQVIDSYGRSAFATKAEFTSHKIPQYANGPALIASNYKPCHVGEAELIQFLMKFLNITPLQRFDRNRNEWIDNKQPGELTIDHWDKLCAGDVSEIAEYVAYQPDNKVKVIFGVRTTDDNRTYQTFLSSLFLGNGAFVDKTSGVYSNAQKEINRYMDRQNADSPVTYTFSALPVHEWAVTASNVEEGNEDMPDFDAPATEEPDGLPF